MNRKLIKWGIAVSAGIALLDALVLEKLFFEVNEFTIGKENSSRKIRILLLSDLHFRRRLWPFYTKLAKKINDEIKPDLILVAGDIVDETGKYVPARKFFDSLDSSIPKAGIIGNHDHKSKVSMEQFKALYESNNGTFLLNESKAFTFGDKRIMVTGLDDYIEGWPSLSDAIQNVGYEENHVMLLHSPKQQEKVRKQLKKINAKRNEENRLNVQYIFSGHNHGGQVKFFGFAPIMPEKSGKYMNGWYKKKPPYLYVSKGFGTSTLPFRFGARAEVTLFNFGV